MFQIETGEYNQETGLWEGAELDGMEEEEERTKLEMCDDCHITYSRLNVSPP